jgi:hypothetical protein
LSEPVGYYKEGGKTRPITQPLGIEGKQINKGINAPAREYSRAVPQAELAHARTQVSHLKSLNARLKALRSGGNARKEMSKEVKAKKEEVANQNLRIAHAFLARHEAIRKGQVPPPVDISIINEPDAKTIPTVKPKKEIEIELAKKMAQARREQNIIQKMNEQPPPPPSQPSPAIPTVDYTNVPSPTTYTPATEQPQKPKQKSQLSSADLALLYPARG